MERILNTRIFRQECPFEIYLILSQTDSASRSSDSTRCQQDHLRPPAVAKSVLREKKNNIDNITEAINLHANPKILQQKVAEATEPKLTFKEISNIKRQS